MHLTVSDCFTSFDTLDAPGLRFEAVVTERHLETVENTMTAAAKLVAFRDLNKALQAKAYRPFVYSKLLALCAAGRIPSYTSALRTCRGIPTRLFDVDEVIAVIEASVKPAV